MNSGFTAEELSYMDLKAQRQKLGLTQQKVADRAHVRLAQYQWFEGGQRDILNASFSVASRVLKALELDLNEFYEENVAQMKE